jgi:hypothetical protein
LNLRSVNEVKEFKGEAENPKKRVRKFLIHIKLSLLIYKDNYFMKKAKIILTAVAIFAIVGGALAYKAKGTFTHKLYTGTTSTLCSSTFAITTDDGPSLVYTGTVPNFCPIITFTKADL